MSHHNSPAEADILSPRISLPCRALQCLRNGCCTISGLDLTKWWTLFCSEAAIKSVCSGGGGKVKGLPKLRAPVVLTCLSRSQQRRRGVDGWMEGWREREQRLEGAEYLVLSMNLILFYLCRCTIETIYPSPLSASLNFFYKASSLLKHVHYSTEDGFR